MLSSIPANGEARKIINNTDDPMQKFKIVYWICPLIGALVLFIQSFNLVATVFGFGVGLLIAYLLFQAIAISDPDLGIKKGLTGVTITYRSVTSHTIYLNAKKKLFSIKSKMTIKGRVKRGGKSNSATEYRNAFALVPFIISLVEDATKQ